MTGKVIWSPRLIRGDWAILTTPPSKKPISTTDALLQVSTFTYDQVGNLMTFTPPQGASYGTKYTYDHLNRRLSVTQAPGTTDQTVASVEYTALGLKSAIIDPDGVRSEYTYDALKFLSQVVEGKNTPAERTIKYDNDLVGNVLVIHDPRGSYYDTSQTYDKVYRLLTTTRNTGTS